MTFSDATQVRLMVGLGLGGFPTQMILCKRYCTELYKRCSFWDSTELVASTVLSLALNCNTAN